MSGTAQLTPLVDRLRELTAGGQAEWGFVDGTYEVVLDNGTEIAVRRDGSAADLTYALTLTPDGSDTPLYAERVAGDDPLFGPLADLHDMVDRRVREDVLSETMRLLGSSVAAGGRRSVRMPEITLPPRPTRDDADRLFAALAGRWALDYTSGTEVAEISEAGVYSYVRPAVPPRPALQLKLIAFAAADRKVEVAKDELSGMARQVEVLTLDDFDRPQRMDGVVQHDRRPLHYRRVS